jgi:SAM-dependent methyltransferase
MPSFSSITRLLDDTSAYRVFQNLVGNRRHFANFVREVVQPCPGARILDVGCGPADILEFLPANIEYDGFDLNADYIKHAETRFKDRGRFFCCEVKNHPGVRGGSYDLVLANGVLHHLDDAEASKLFEIAFNALAPGGRLITYDGCYTPEQSFVVKLLLSMDRGKFVRTQKEYLALAHKAFETVESFVGNWYRIPYTLLFLVCRK